MEAKLNILIELYRIALENPENFPERATQAIRKAFDLIACSYYSYSAERNLLIIRAQSGFDYADYHSYTLPDDTCAGDPIRRDEQCSTINVRKSIARFRDKKLINRHGLELMLSIKISHAKSVEYAGSTAMGVICLYPRDRNQLSLVQKSAKEIASVFSHACRQNNSESQLRMRTSLLSNVGYSTDLSGLVRRIQSAFHSSFTFDESVLLVGLKDFSRFNLMAASDHKVQKDHHLYSYREEDIKLLCGNRDYKKISFTHLTEKPMLRFPVSENTEIKNLTYCPIVEASVHPTRKDKSPKVIGVFLGINHKLSLGGVERSVPLSWEEYENIQFFSSMVSILIYFMSKSLSERHDIDRRFHGAKNLLDTIHSKLMVLDIEVDVDVDSFYSYYLSDSVAFIEDLRSQVYRSNDLDVNDYELERVSLYGEVLSKLPQLVKRYASFHDYGKIEVNQLNENKNITKLPAVQGNTADLNAVFRNLCENAVKYCDPNDESGRMLINIDAEWSEKGNYVSIFVSDNGEGIEADYADRIFEDGYRSDSAVARHPASAGMGLADCHKIVQRMGGSIELVSNKKLTKFLIKLKKYEE